MAKPRSSDIDRFLGHRIKQLRLVAHRTQQQVAEQLGVTYQQVHKFEKGINRFSAGQLFAVAQTFDARVADLFDGYSGAPIDPLVDAETTQMLLNVTRSFLALEPKHQEALVRLTRALAAED
jgi:transcriptional regulator with XRE-family HTH domain